MSERLLLDDCFLTDRERLSHDEALDILRARIRPLARTETVPLVSALGRIVAERIASRSKVPAADNAAVDGYAFAYADYETGAGTFPVSGRLAAGHPPSAALMAGTAVRIFTGAVLPEGADTVVMQEDCAVERNGDNFVVTVPPGLKRGANRRRAGEDLTDGAVIAVPGMRLRPQEIAAIASVGRDAVSVFRPLRIALLSTGDEIVRPGRPAGTGQVYDSNHFLLAALLQTVGCAMHDAGVLPDNAQAARAALVNLAGEHDAVLTTGGASRGEEDHLIRSLEAVGKRHLWQLAVKPGRPMGFGQIGDCPVIALPGNPVAAFVCFLLYVRPMLTVLAGGLWPEPQRFDVVAGFDLPERKTGRREFLRGALSRDQGRAMVIKFPRDGSGLITSLREADGLIEITEEVAAVRPGDTVPFLPFSGFGLPV